MEAIKEFLLTLLQTLLVACVPVIVTYITKYINAKIKNITIATKGEKQRAMLEDIQNTIESAVAETQQTYVDELKKTGRFTKENQAEAFAKTWDKVLVLLKSDAKDFLAEYQDDATEWLTTQIEKTVHSIK